MPNLNYGVNDLDNGTQDGTQDGTQGGTQEQITELMLRDSKITRKKIAAQLNISVRTLQRILNDMPNVQYVGRGANGHWEIDN